MAAILVDGNEMVATVSKPKRPAQFPVTSSPAKVAARTPPAVTGSSHLRQQISVEMTSEATQHDRSCYDSESEECGDSEGGVIVRQDGVPERTS